MKFKFKFLLPSWCLFVAHCGTPYSFKDLSYFLLNNKYQPTEPLQNLLQICKIEHNETLSDIVTQTQATWLRPAGMERFQMTDSYQNRKHQFHKFFVELGLINEIPPIQKSYKYAVVYGSTVSRIRKRLAYLIHIWKSGIRFDNIVFLTGQRFLDPFEESEQTLCNRQQMILPIRSTWDSSTKKLPKTESDLMLFIYEQAELPENLRKIPLTLIDAPQIQAQKGKFTRPTTLSTIEEWLKTDPQPGTCLAISDQPYIGYQDSVMRTLLPTQFKLETVGPELAPESESVALCLDSLARWLYQEKIRNRGKSL